MVINKTTPGTLYFAFALPLQRQGSWGKELGRSPRRSKLGGSTDADVAISLVTNTGVVINAARSDERGVSVSCHTRLSLLHSGSELTKGDSRRAGSVVSASSSRPRRQKVL
jgi:hypothetical protein